MKRTVVKRKTSRLSRARRQTGSVIDLASLCTLITRETLARFIYVSGY